MVHWLFVSALSLGTLPLAMEEALVEGVGMVPIEDHYLPSVVACENGAAEPAALVAQAIAARSYLYYELERNGMIADGTGAQVYTCGREPEAQHHAAVNESRHLVLALEDTVVAAFYVAGATPSDPSCIAMDSDLDPTNTERFVTYNMGRSGRDITQTPLGFIDPNNLANRGCMSQNGSRCLAQRDLGHEAILRFYYGDDIRLALLDTSFLGDSSVDRGGCRCLGAPTTSPASWVLVAIALVWIARPRRTRRLSGS